MKKLFPLFLFIVLLGAPVSAFADDVALGGTCTQPTDCIGDLTCTNGKCAYETCPGGAKDECPGTQTCNPTTLVCQDSAGQTGTSTGTSTQGSQSNLPTSIGFIPLTNIPGINSVGNSGDLSAFLNNIYKICIGLAAVIAVLQFIRAGLLYMLEGGFMEKKEAKNLMLQTLTGLFLVLSPVIVFSIINPKILSLQIGVGGLETGIKQPPGGTYGGDLGAKICTGYTKFQTVTLSGDQHCKDVIKPGDGWTDLPDGCPGQTVPAGQTLCGYSSTGSSTDLGGTGDGAYQYSVEQKETDGIAADDCRISSTKGFSDKTACEAALKTALGFPFVVETQNCDKQSVNPPTPESVWNTIKDLPVCSPQ